MKVTRRNFFGGLIGTIVGFVGVGKIAAKEEPIKSNVLYIVPKENEKMYGKIYIASPGAIIEPWDGKPIDMEYQRGWSQLVDFVLGAGFKIK